MSYEKLSVALMLALALVSCRNTENRYYTWVDKAALREAPSLDARTVAWLDQGEDVEFTGERSKHTTNVELRHQRFDRHWITVKTASGHTGWMHEATLKPYGELLKRVANERDWNPEYESILLPLIKGNAREFAKAAASMRVPGAPEPGMPAKNFPRLMHQYAGYTDNPAIREMLRSKVRHYYQPARKYFQSLPAVPPGHAAIASGSVIAALTDGDYFLPVFSPNGRRLACARKAIRRGVTEYSKNKNDPHDFVTGELILLDTSTWQPTLCLQADACAKYRVYAAPIIGIEWRSNDRLTVTLHDGDVDNIELTVDALSCRILKHEVDGGGERGYERSRHELEARLAPYQPADAPLAFESGNRALVTGAFIVQDFTDNGSRSVLRMLDFSKKAVRVIRPVPDFHDGAFNGAARMGDDFILALNEAWFWNERFYVLRYREGKTPSVLLALDVNEQYPYLREAGMIRGRALLRISGSPAHAGYYEYAAGRLLRATDFPVIDSIVVSPDGALAAFCYREKPGACDRRIAVKRM